MRNALVGKYRRPHHSSLDASLISSTKDGTVLQKEEGPMDRDVRAETNPGSDQRTSLR